MKRDPVEELAELRRSIDNFDAALIHILAERFRCTKAVGRLSDQLRRVERGAIDSSLFHAESKQLLHVVERTNSTPITEWHEAFAGNLGDKTKIGTAPLGSCGDIEDDHSTTIDHTATSTDLNYDGIAIDSVTAEITDNDS